MKEEKRRFRSAFRELFVSKMQFAGIKRIGDNFFKWGEQFEKQQWATARL
jgi:hypothetical protein